MNYEGIFVAKLTGEVITKHNKLERWFNPEKPFMVFTNDPMFVINDTSEYPFADPSWFSDVVVRGRKKDLHLLIRHAEFVNEDPSRYQKLKRMTRKEKEEAFADFQKEMFSDEELNLRDVQTLMGD